MRDFVLKTLGTGVIYSPLYYYFPLFSDVQKCFIRIYYTHVVRFASSMCSLIFYPTIYLFTISIYLSIHFYSDSLIASPARGWGVREEVVRREKGNKKGKRGYGNERERGRTGER